MSERAEFLISSTLWSGVSDQTSSGVLENCLLFLLWISADKRPSLDGNNIFFLCGLDTSESWLGSLGSSSSSNFSLSKLASATCTRGLDRRCPLFFGTPQARLLLSVVPEPFPSAWATWGVITVVSLLRFGVEGRQTEGPMEVLSLRPASSRLVDCGKSSSATKSLRGITLPSLSFLCGVRTMVVVRRMGHGVELSGDACLPRVCLWCLKQLQNNPVLFVNN